MNMQALAQGAEVLMRRVAKTPQALDFDVVIIGSGYGGAVAAARLAQVIQPDGKRLRIGVLERGREFLPGDFPDRFSALAGQLRWQNHDAPTVIGSHDGLFDLHFNEQINVLRANGLGGGSLINASVTERVDPAVWRKPIWPDAWPKSAADWEPYYQMAESMLAVSTLAPERWPRKTRQMERLGKAAPQAVFRPVKLALNQEDRTNQEGIAQRACVGCGDCFTGCNFNAKNTLTTNYLPRAKRLGAELFTGATVNYLAQTADGIWLVHYCLSHHADTRAVLRARHVIVAAGSLGSTEIMLRSQAHGLALSKALGTRFSGNGDMIWAGYRQRDKVRPGAAQHTPWARRQVGPTITAMLDFRASGGPVIQDAAVPGALQRLFAEILTSSALLYRMDKWATSEDGLHDPDAVHPLHMQYSGVYLSMGHHDGRPERDGGKIEYRSTGTGHIRIDWHGVGNNRLYRDTEKLLHSAVADLHGTLLANPVWRPYPPGLGQIMGATGEGNERKLVTVHPLGGCPMGNDAAHGVVNHLGAVFDPRSASATYPGLYVWDGSIMPGSLGINPLLGITAMAERAVAHLIAASGWQAGSPGLPPTPAAAWQTVPWPATPEKPPAPTLRFSETMRGTLSSSNNDTRFAASLQVDFRFKQHTMQFLSNPARKLEHLSARLQLDDGRVCRLEGEVHWLTLLPETIMSRTVRAMASYTRLRLLPDLAGRHRRYLRDWLENAWHWPARLWSMGKLASHTGTRRELRYVLRPCQTDHGMPWPQSFVLTGTKVVAYAADRPLWDSLSELAVVVSAEGRSLAHGTLVLDWKKLLQRESMQIDSNNDNSHVWLDMLSSMAFFLRAIIRIHFWSLRKPDYVNKERAFPFAPLHLAGLPPGLRHTIRVGNDAEIRLTHYPAATHAHSGTLPPVMLIHGFGASSMQFASPHMPENLTQYLCRQGREVWLLDLRTSIAVEGEIAQKTKTTQKGKMVQKGESRQWTLDEIAQQDIPAAVHYILAQYQEQNLAGIDVVAHCIGSAMFNVAVLSGKLQNEQGKSLIHAAVLLQVAPIFTVSRSNRIRGMAAERVRDLFDVMGTKSVDSSVDHKADWKDIMLDRLLGTHPLPRSEYEQVIGRFMATPRDDLANYFRSTGVFGRLFDLDSLTPAMRRSLGDLLGPTNLRTYQQILHCLLAERVVDRFGRNLYVRDSALAKYYRFPTLFAHGENNDIFAREGSMESARLLGAIFSPSAFRYQNLPGFGHLDPLVGKLAAANVFPLIAEFLAAPPPLPHPQPVAGTWHRAPELGPVLGWLRPHEQQPGWLQLRIWVKVDEMTHTAEWVETMRISHAGKPVWSSYQCHRIVPIARFMVAVFDLDLPEQGNERILIASRHRVQIDAPLNRVEAPIDLAPELPCLIKHLCRDDVDADPTTALSEQELTENARSLWQRWQNDATCAALLDPAPHVRQSQARAPSLCFALGSCRYSGSPLEIDQGDQCFARLVQHIEHPGTPAPWQPQFYLMMGDQIYVDATAGVLERNERLELFLERYRDAYRSPWAAKLATMLPCYNMLDDHEIINDWEDLGYERALDPTEKRWNQMGKAAFVAYQWAHGPRNGWTNQQGQRIAAQPCDKFAAHLWYCFDCNDFPFFLMDTRLERQSRWQLTDAAANPTLASRTQMRALEQWLVENQKRHGNRPKFVVSPSAMVPIASDELNEYRCRSDGWNAYPESIRQLADIVIDNQIENLVMLFGDMHACFASQVSVTRADGGCANWHALVFSPLYAPYPFINTQTDEVEQQYEDALSEQAPQYRLQYKVLWQDDRYQGFGLIQVAQANQRWVLTIQAPAADTNQGPGSTALEPFQINLSP